ncbi:Uncharacterized tRNA/rRNA methyltransferase Rv0881 [Chlamydiales bacterium SCGC AG-110-P3]|nr:Uncharacterized tRNA/rRNA methyltransferase Rv0881 [Chlamydiales bacterium SCGC AG-110-P3]
MRSTRPWLKDTQLPIDADAELVVAEGKKVVLSLLASERPVIAVLAERHYYDTAFCLMLDARGVSAECRYVADNGLLKEVVGYRMHQGVMAIGVAPDQVAVDALQAPIVVLNGLANAENVGAIIRNCVAFGVQNLLIDSGCASPFSRRSVKVAMGTVFGIQWHRTESLSSALESLSQRGVTVIAADTFVDSVSLSDYMFPSNYALVLGSEGHGLNPSVLDCVDAVVRVPMQGNVDSLNVAAASAVFLYHAQHLGKCDKIS